MAFRSLTKSFHKQQLYKGGTMELLNKPEFKDVDKAKNLFTLLEEQDMVANLLMSDEGAHNKKVSVRIGDEANLSSINDCSIIEATFSDDNVVLGKIAVLGPTRMEYAKIIGLLDFMKQHLQYILEHYHGPDKADVIVANIVSDAIIALLPALPKYLREGGIFIASGIIDDRIEDIRRAADENNFIWIDEQLRNGWYAVRMRWM